MTLPIGPTLDRRGFLKLAGLSWLTPVGRLLADQAERTRQPAQSIILLWLDGGPSQLETFDPHPDTRIAGGTKAIATAVAGHPARRGLRATGRPDGLGRLDPVDGQQGGGPRARHVPDEDRLPARPDGRASLDRRDLLPRAAGGPDRHPPAHLDPDRAVAEPGRVPGRRVRRVPGRRPEGEAARRDLAACPPPRELARVQDLEVVERAFARGRRGRVEATLHRETLARARVMMTSEQLKAFDVSQEPAARRAPSTATPRSAAAAWPRAGSSRSACAASRSRSAAGTRTSTTTRSTRPAPRCSTRRSPPCCATCRGGNLLDRTVVLCCGEFGRTPKVNPLGGRDHWPGGFSLALAGGGIRGGLAIGQTDPEGVKDPVRPTTIEDVHATVLTALGLNPAKENIAPATGRPIKLSAGKPIRELLG